MTTYLLVAALLCIMPRSGRDSTRTLAAWLTVELIWAALFWGAA